MYFLITKAMAFSCLLVVVVGSKHFQNSFHHDISVDNQGFDAECLGGRRREEGEVLPGAD